MAKHKMRARRKKKGMQKFKVLNQLDFTDFFPWVKFYLTL